MTNQINAHKWGKYSLYVTLILFVIFQIGANLSLKMTSNQYNSNMAFFQTQFMNTAYVIFGLCMMIPMQIIGEKQPDSKWGIPPEHRSWSNHFTYFVTGVLDAWACYAMGISGNGVPGDWQTILQQLTFPLTVIISPFVFSKTKANIIRCWNENPKYIAIYILGTIMLIFGIIVSVIPALKQGSTYSITDLIIFLSSPIVSVISWLMKERLFDMKVASAVHLNIWNAIYMIHITFVYLPIQTIGMFGGIPKDHLIQITLVDGWKCFVGQIDGCNGAWWTEILYSISTFGAGACAVVLCKQGSASFQWAANIFAVPLSCLFFAIPNLPGNSTESLTVNIICGLIIVVVGMILYERTDNHLKSYETVDVVEAVHTTPLINHTIYIGTNPEGDYLD